MNKGDIVRWAKPMPDEGYQDRYVVTEVNDDRCFIRFICDMSIQPIMMARCADLVVVSTREG